MIRTDKMSIEQLNNLNSNDVLAIKLIALGKTQGFPKNERIKAVWALPYLAGAKDCKILNEIVKNENEEISIRAIAVEGIGRLSKELAEKYLIKNLIIKNEFVLNIVLKHLGRIGGKKALKALDSVFEIKRDFINIQLLFAKALISYRLGLERNDIQFVEASNKEIERDSDLLEISVKTLPPNRIDKSLRLLGDNTYGIDINKNLCYEINCNDAKWTLFLNSIDDQDNLFPSITKRKMIAGLIALFSERWGTYIVQYIIFTDPHDDIIDIMLVSSDGKIYYSGHGSIRNDEIMFSISNIDLPGNAPTKITGRFGVEGLKLDEILVSAKT